MARNDKAKLSQNKAQQRQSFRHTPAKRHSSGPKVAMTSNHIRFDLVFDMGTATTEWRLEHDKIEARRAEQARDLEEMERRVIEQGTIQREMLQRERDIEKIAQEDRDLAWAELRAL